MPATLDLVAVAPLHRGFRQTAGPDATTARGMVCANLDQSINHYVELCRELRTYINQWARAIFTGQVTFDQEVENLLKEESRRNMHRAKQVAALGRAMDGECYVLQGLNPLHRHIADFDYLLENWVSPRLAVSPAPRVKLSHAAEKQIAERSGKLSPLDQFTSRHSFPNQLGRTMALRQPIPLTTVRITASEARIPITVGMAIRRAAILTRDRFRGYCNTIFPIGSCTAPA